jgi:FkbH-like protein
MYREDIARSESERAFDGPPEAFMASLELDGEIVPATAADLERAHELTVRTNQLNSSGRTYSKAELEALMNSSDHQVLTLRLRDRFGDYGQVGLILIETAPTHWTIKLLLISCRVMSRGAGVAAIAFLLGEARRREIQLFADFRATGRNRQMLVTYRFAGFQIVQRCGEDVVLAHDGNNPLLAPAWIRGRVQC